MTAAASAIAEMLNPGNKAHLYTFIFGSDCQRIFRFNLWQRHLLVTLSFRALCQQTLWALVILSFRVIMVSSVVIYQQLSCVVIVLFKQASPFSALNSWEIAECIVVSRLWWDNHRYCGITSHWVYNPSLEGLRIHLNNLCPRLETSSNQVQIVGFVDTWTIVC